MLELLLVTAVAPAASIRGEGEHCCEHFGTALANLGDVDGDGVPDHAISCPLKGNVGPTECVWSFSGATGRPLWRADAPTAKAWFGQWLRVAGDVDGDGSNDLLVSSWSLPVYVVSGDDGRILRTIGETQHRFSTTPPFDGLGDVDGDGRDDFVIGNALYSGGTFELVRVLAGPPASEFARVSIVGIDDVDADGARDLAFASADLGGCWLSLVSSRTGECLLVVDEWRTGTMINDWDGTRWTKRLAIEVEPRFGLWMERAGDFDCDGFVDLIIGASSSERALGRTWIVDGRLCQPLAVIDADVDAPFSVGALGDVDRDGFADIGLARRFVAWDVTGVRRLHGPANALSVSEWQRESFDRDWGCVEVERVEPAGDVDCDGYDDYLLGVLCTSDPGPPGFVLLVSGRTGEELRRYDSVTALANFASGR